MNMINYVQNMNYDTKFYEFQPEDFQLRFIDEIECFVAEEMLKWKKCKSINGLMWWEEPKPYNMCYVAMLPNFSSKRWTGTLFNALIKKCGFDWSPGLFSNYLVLHSTCGKVSRNFPGDLNQSIIDAFKFLNDDIKEK